MVFKRLIIIPDAEAAVADPRLFTAAVTDMNLLRGFSTFIIGCGAAVVVAVFTKLILLELWTAAAAERCDPLLLLLLLPLALPPANDSRVAAVCGAVNELFSSAVVLRDRDMDSV